MLTLPQASDTQVVPELVFDTHLKKITALIELMLTKFSLDPTQGEANPNVATLKSFQQTVNQHPRDLSGLKAQAKSFLVNLNHDDTKWLDFILSLANYLDHELSTLECYVSKAEEARNDYLNHKPKKGWYDAAVNLGPILAQCRTEKDLNKFKAKLLEFCNTQLVSNFSRQSQTFKPSLEAIANAIPSNECALALGSSLSSQAVQSVRDQMQKQESTVKFMTEKAVSYKLENDELRAKYEALSLQLKKSEDDNASLSCQLSDVTDQLSTLSLEKAEMIQAQRRDAASKSGGFLENLFGMSGDSDRAQPIVHAHKAAAKTPAASRAPSKPASSSSSATPPALKMEDKKPVSASNAKK